MSADEDEVDQSQWFTVKAEVPFHYLNGRWTPTMPAHPAPLAVGQLWLFLQQVRMEFLEQARRQSSTTAQSGGLMPFKMFVRTQQSLIFPDIT
eukprot:TRINITY_DN7637_c0_g1_i2.p1 TRINITY_DN7637_c0_g1~~TRINITY_DN7637_c0_g1_i2.p1  ORF type:complete len:106 (-),score=13.97 TRINITY_DN7637_c0_g1_i2:136-414(-)